MSQEKKKQLQQIANSRKTPLREGQRVNILLHYAEGVPITHVEKTIHMSTPTIYKWIDKALAVGVDEGLKDKYHRAKERGRPVLGLRPFLPPAASHAFACPPRFVTAILMTFDEYKSLLPWSLQDASRIDPSLDEPPCG